MQGSITNRIYPHDNIAFVSRQSLQRILDMFDSLTDLDPLQRRIIKERYSTLHLDFQGRSRRYSALFYTFRVIVTVGSLFVPAMLSIQYTNVNLDGNRQSYEFTIYWLTWLLSLAVTTSNGIYTLFKVDKKYYYLVTAFELLKSEAWQYLELTGRYASRPTGPRSTHLNQYLYFTHALEKHKLKQVEEEYFKFYDHESSTDANYSQKSSAQGGGSHQAAAPAHDALAPPTPDKSLLEISRTISPETLMTVNNILASLGKTATPDAIISKIQAAARRASINSVALMSRMSSGAEDATTPHVAGAGTGMHDMSDKMNITVVDDN
jgi:hypothetical protein